MQHIELQAISQRVSERSYNPSTDGEGSRCLECVISADHGHVHARPEHLNNRTLLNGAVIAASCQKPRSISASNAAENCQGGAVGIRARVKKHGWDGF
jgi:hypothetical protein